MRHRDLDHAGVMRRARVLAAIDSGAKLKEIAKFLHISCGRVQQLRDKAHRDRWYIGGLTAQDEELSVEDLIADHWRYMRRFPKRVQARWATDEDLAWALAETLDVFCNDQS